MILNGKLLVAMCDLEQLCMIHLNEDIYFIMRASFLHETGSPLYKTDVGTFSMEVNTASAQVQLWQHYCLWSVSACSQ